MRIIRPPAWRNGYGLDAIARLVAYRDLLITLSMHRLSVRYKQSSSEPVGRAAAAAMMVVFTAVFSRLAQACRAKAAPYALFAYAGLLPWTLFASSVTNGTDEPRRQREADDEGVLSA